MKQLVWRIYDDSNTSQAVLVAATFHAEDAAAMAAHFGDGHRVTYCQPHTSRYVDVWREGSEDFPAAESYDRAAELMHKRAGLC